MLIQNSMVNQKPSIAMTITFKGISLNLALIKEAIKQKKPIFSVCRGTQLFNVAMGGTLYQDYRRPLAGLFRRVHELNAW